MNLVSKLDAVLSSRTTNSSAGCWRVLARDMAAPLAHQLEGMFTRSRSNSSPVQNDRALVAQAQRGETAAFERLYLAHQRRGREGLGQQVDPLVQPSVVDDGAAGVAGGGVWSSTRR